MSFLNRKVDDYFDSMFDFDKNGLLNMEEQTMQFDVINKLEKERNSNFFDNDSDDFDCDHDFSDFDGDESTPGNILSSRITIMSCVPRIMRSATS